LAILDAAIHRTANQFGGVFRLFVSVLSEILVSVLLAPIRMMAHSRYVLGALLNVSLTWAGQNRTQETSWRDAFLTQFPGMVIAAAWSAFAWSLDPMFFLWSLDRKSTRLNSSHVKISYAVFCLKTQKQRFNKQAKQLIYVSVIFCQEAPV